MNRNSDAFKGGDFCWFTGVVEDINDPDKLGRVRVRCFGYHDESLTEIPTNSLPFATVMGPTNSAHISGIGTTTHGLVNGTWVVGFFRDGPSAQDPIIMGTIASTYEEKPHMSGTFVEIHPNGDVVQKNKDKYQITNGNDEVHITGTCNVTIDGKAVLTVKKDFDIDVRGNLSIDASKDVFIDGKNVHITSNGGNINLN
jgi:hypothetical protein